MFGISNILSAFSAETIGTKVLNKGAFMEALTLAMQGAEFSEYGTAMVAMPEDSLHTVSAGQAKLADAKEIVTRTHRGAEDEYILRQSDAPKVDSLKVLVYTQEAYNADPDTTDEQSAEFVIVAVLGSTGADAIRSPKRMEQNRAGGNPEVMAWTEEEYQSELQKSIDHHAMWRTVAD